MSTQKKTSKKPKESSSKASLVVLIILIIGAFCVRVLGQLDKVFAGNNIWFRGVDSWYHMRLADITAARFPDFLTRDMYAIFPNGHQVGYLPLNSWIIGFFGQVFDYEIVGALLPAIVGALTLIPTYLIGREVFSRKVGLIASLLVAMLPGEFLHRTLLGFTDHHALEAFLMPMTLWLFLRAYRTSKLKWHILAGLSLGLYHLAWAGTSLFVIIIGIWTWLEFLRRFKKNEDIYSLFKLISIPVLIGLITSYAFLSTQAKLVSLGVLGVSITLWLLTRYIKDREAILFALTILVPVGLTIVGFFHSWNDLLLTFFWKGGTTVQEVVPLSLPIILATYGIAFFMTIGGLWFCPRNKNTGLFLVWSIILILMSIGQRRWGYYTTIPVALLASYFTYRIASWMNSQVRVAAVIVITVFLLMPNIQGTLRMANLPNNINADWYVALTWLEENSPNPFPENYYLSTEQTKKASYGVLSWWDYGHWIIRIAKRVPTDSPTLTSNKDSKFFTARTEEEALKIAQGIQYVIVDRSLLEGKWYAVSHRGNVNVPELENSQLYRLWADQSPNWTKVFEKGEVKVFERSNK